MGCGWKGERQVYCKSLVHGSCDLVAFDHFPRRFPARIQSMLKLITDYEGSSSALSKWEDAGDTLANALATYLRSCMFLETFSPKNVVDTQHLASRIDFSLNTLHTKLSQELAQSRALLSRMRNKTVSRFYSIPNEIISAIFMEIVYAPAPGDQRLLSMKKSLKIIFGRLYKLLSVCSSWRNIAISLNGLWSIVPIVCGIIFSEKLVELRLQSVVLGYNSKLTSFLRVLQSASELQELKIISVVAFPDGSSPPDTISNFTFPKLKSLLLEDLDFNVLRILLGSIAPGSHRLTLFLTPKSRHIYEPDEDPEEVDMQRIYDLLGVVAVDTLLLNGSWADTMWLSETELRDILQLLPSLKTLKMVFWRLKKAYLQALKRPHTGSSYPNTIRFPRLETLCIISYIGNTAALYDAVNSHPIRTMELDGYIPISSICSDSEDDDLADEDFDECDPITDDCDIARRLRAIVPRFQVVDSALEMEDFNRHLWQLW
ncbi:hypothetical protein RSAG8_08664, partial [Rhizoctonia solani AG-8 WAC10335]